MPDALEAAFPHLTPLIDGTELALVGGQADEARLKVLLQGLARSGGDGVQPVRRWRALEWTDRMVLEEEPPALPEKLDLLVWGRWFGTTGDLEVWRDADRFRWRFVGDPSSVPELQAGDANAFAADRKLRVRCVDRSAYLWAREDARVATATADSLRLLTPRAAPMMLKYREYLDSGSVAAVRYLALAPAPRPTARSREG